MTTTQRKLVLNDPTMLVLAPVATAREKLPGHDEDDILQLIEEGFILFAWDIALQHGSAARLFRIFPDCIDHYKSTGGSRPFPLSFDQVIARLVPDTGKPYLTSITAGLILNCSSTHVINLLQAKALALLPGTTYDRGPGNSALITRASFIKFLQTRLEGGL